MNINKLQEFVRPYYTEKDIMHGLWHIELVAKAVAQIIDKGTYDANIEHLTYATYFHGCVLSNSSEIMDWLTQQGLSNEECERIILIALESHRTEIPTTLEGKILHDAHILEGGKAYMITKCLITGSVRGQTLFETIEYIEKNILHKSVCYLAENKQALDEVNSFTKKFLAELKFGIEQPKGASHAITNDPPKRCQPAN